MSVSDSTLSPGIDPLHRGVKVTPAGKSDPSIWHRSWKWVARVTEELITEPDRGPAQIVDPRDRIAQLISDAGVGKAPGLQRGADEAEVILDPMVHFPDEKLFLVQRRLHGLQRTSELDGSRNSVPQSGQEIHVIRRKWALGYGNQPRIAQRHACGNCDYRLNDRRDIDR